MLAPGIIISDSYRVERLLGTGGMADVYLVSHVRMPRKFAIKVMQIGSDLQPVFIERFRREVEILATLRGAHIVDVIDTGQLADGSPFLVMELLEGEDLSHFMQRNGAVSPAVALSICCQVGDALMAAHAAGVIHRDLKPANIFLCRHGPFPNFVKVLDFGIAKLSQRDDDPTITAPSVLMGTPAYMAPEQALGKAHLVDGRTDQFALAAVLYEMICGRPAFFRPGDSVYSTLDHVVSYMPEPLPQKEIWEAVQRALSKDPEQRFPTLEGFLAALGSTTTSLYQAKASLRSLSRPITLANYEIPLETLSGGSSSGGGRRGSGGSGGSGGGSNSRPGIGPFIKRFWHLPLLITSATFLLFILKSQIIQRGRNALGYIIKYEFLLSSIMTIMVLIALAFYLNMWWKMRSISQSSENSGVLPSGKIPLNCEIHGFEVKKRIYCDKTISVYKGESKLSFHVSIHVLSREGCRDSAKIQRFINSANALKTLNNIAHPCLARFINIDHYIDGTPYMITEFYPGETLREKLSKKEKFSESAVIQIGLALSEVLAACHDNGVVHRALSPSSILFLEKSEHVTLTPDRIKLLGFSMVKLMDGHKIEKAKQVQTLLGKSVGVGIYMAPEQVVGSADVDGKADVFVLGMLLGELVIGKPVCEVLGIEQAKCTYMTADVFPLFPNTQDPLKNIIYMMTMRSAASRPTMKEIHDKLRMINSPTNSSSMFPSHSVHDISLGILPNQFQVQFSHREVTASRGTAAALAVSIPKTTPLTQVTEHLLTSLPEAMIFSLEAALEHNQDEGARRHIVRNWFLNLHEDVFSALYCDVFPSLHKNNRAETRRQSRINTILEQFTPEEIVIKVRSYAQFNHNCTPKTSITQS